MHFLQEADSTHTQNDQARACAAIARYNRSRSVGADRFSIFSCNMPVSEDGALHAEKFYRTVSEEFAATRPAFRWRHWWPSPASPPANTASPPPARRSQGPLGPS